LAGSQPQKRLFNERWYQILQNGDYGSWMTLSMSQIWFECGYSADDCASRWKGPTDAGIADWNNQQTTVRFNMLPDYNQYYDVNIYILDLIFDDPSIRGL